MFEMSDEAQTIKVYNFLADTKEFIGVSDCYIPPGTGLPAYCTDIKVPEATEGSVACFDNDEWLLKEDHRGKTVWDKTTRREVLIEQLGPIPETFTRLKPKSDFDVWDGEKWVKDEKAERKALVSDAENQKISLLRKANDVITPLQDAVELEMASDDEQNKLTVWRKYRVQLSRVDTSTAPDVAWPESPATESPN
ncbi:tail fiber assembly protein [Serratia marcescens]|uniref:tail fiber assembly protein n=1 Tax=Serratia marcescens TaxID=615 RepID=UPI0039839E48